MRLPRSDAASVPDTSETLPEAKLPRQSWLWKNSVLVLNWRPMTCLSPRQLGGRCPSALPAYLTAHIVGGIWGNTSPAAAAADNTWVWTALICCLRSNAHCRITAYPASALYQLAAMGMAFPLYSPHAFSLYSYFTEDSIKMCSENDGAHFCLATVQYHISHYGCGTTGLTYIMTQNHGSQVCRYIK